MRENSERPSSWGDCERLGPGKHHSKEVRILNRILRYTDAGLRWETDPRHAELLLKALALDRSANSVCTPCTKPKDPESLEEQEEITALANPDGYSAGVPNNFDNPCAGVIKHSEQLTEEQSFKENPL